ncbi:uncharacterized membrane protein YoaT (DUF817 family) [Peribacillus sp. B2I2]
MLVVPLQLRLNFFTHIIGLTFIGVYLDLKLSFFCNHGAHTRLMELVTVCHSHFLLLIGSFISIAENIATFFGAWEYPNQSDAWSIGHLGKVSACFLLVIVSFLIVATLKQVKGKIPLG